MCAVFFFLFLFPITFTMVALHLLVLIHGMWGSPVHLSELNRIVQETHSDPSAEGVGLRVLVAETNREESTYDGIDWGGERVAKEVLKFAMRSRRLISCLEHRWPIRSRN